MVQFDNVTLPSSNGLCRYEALIVKGPGLMQRTVRDVSIGTPGKTDHFGYPVILPGDVYDSLPDATPPSTVTGLTLVNVGGHTATFSWRPATDAESGILRYDIFRNDALVASTMDTVVTDSGLSGLTGYAYTVAAVNGGYRQGTKSQALSVNTAAARFAPAELKIDNQGLKLEQHGSMVTVRYRVPVTQRVTVEIFDSRGRQALSAPGEQERPGEFAADIDARGLVPGSYMVRMQARGIARTARFTLANR
jgi:hypothetical protein